MYGLLIPDSGIELRAIKADPDGMLASLTVLDGGSLDIRDGTSTNLSRSDLMALRGWVDELLRRSVERDAATA